MAPGARSKFGTPMFEPEIFRKHISCIEESTCDIVGTFRHPSQSFGAQQSFGSPTVIGRPGNCDPFGTLVTSLHNAHYEVRTKP